MRLQATGWGAGSVSVSIVAPLPLSIARATLVPSILSSSVSNWTQPPLSSVAAVLVAL